MKPLCKEDVIIKENPGSKPTITMFLENYEGALSWAKSCIITGDGQCHGCGKENTARYITKDAMLCKDCLVSRAFGQVGGKDDEEN